MIAYLIPQRKLLDLMEVTPRCLTNVCLGLKFGEILKLERNSFPPHFTDEKKSDQKLSHITKQYILLLREKEKNISLKRNNLKGSMASFSPEFASFQQAECPKRTTQGRQRGKWVSLSGTQAELGQSKSGPGRWRHITSSSTVSARNLCDRLGCNLFLYKVWGKTVLWLLFL